LEKSGGSAFHTEMERAIAAGHPVWEMPTVDPDRARWVVHRARVF
jgi:hypothetical protein